MLLRCVLLLSVTLLPAQTTPDPSRPAWQRTRAIWFGNEATPTIAAELGFGWEALPFDEAATRAWTDAKAGDRLPLGITLWPTFETFTEVRFDAIDVRAGQYYVALEHTAAGPTLLLLDPGKVRAAQLLPTAAKLPPAIARIALAHEDGQATTTEAEWRLQEDGAQFVLRLGPHTLTANAVVSGLRGAFPLAQPQQRAASRLPFGPTKADTCAFAMLDHGLPQWTEAHAAAAKAMPIGQRWRLGQDWPTTLETNVPMTIGGKKLAAGSWHLALAKAKGDAWNLVVSEAAADYAAKIDGFAPERVQPVLEVPLRNSKAAAPAERLVVEFVTAGKETSLTIRFGATQVHTPVTGAAKGKG